jgi:hypothetical protein
LATNDSAFVSEGNRILAEEKASDKLRVCKLEDVGKLPRTINLDVQVKEEP